MKHTAINIALFAAIVSIMFGIQVIDNHGTEHEVAREELAKQQRDERFGKAAQAVCGPNSDYRLTNKQGEIVCLIRHSKKTRVASL